MSKNKRCDVSKYSLYTKVNEFINWIDVRNKEYEVELQCDFKSLFGAEGDSVYVWKAFENNLKINRHNSHTDHNAKPLDCQCFNHRDK